MSAVEWLLDIGQACDDLGYGIEMIEHGRIRLLPLRGGDRTTIEIESLFLSGAELRRILKPVAENKP